MPWESVRSGGTPSSWEQAVRGGRIDMRLIGLLLVSFGEWEASFLEVSSSEAGSPSEGWGKALTSRVKAALTLLWV